jgi:hypothetical protein
MMPCSFHFQIQLVHNESHWIPACAGMAVAVEATVLISTVIPAKAGIQCLYFASEHIFISRVYADSRSNLAL